ncbi:unnamed protein product, partial [Musa acuminata subsp. burmannicoides]
GSRPSRLSRGRRALGNPSARHGLRLGRILRTRVDGKLSPEQRVRVEEGHPKGPKAIGILFLGE